MDAVEFFKTVKRLCLCKDQDCKECPAAFEDGMCMVMLLSMHCDDLIKSTEKMVLKVEQWAKDHPVKTRQSEFLKRFPNAMINKSDGVLCITPCSIEGESIGCINGKGCDDCYRKYWLTEVTDNGND